MSATTIEAKKTTLKKKKSRLSTCGCVRLKRQQIILKTKKQYLKVNHMNEGIFFSFSVRLHSENCLGAKTSQQHA